MKTVDIFLKLQLDFDKHILDGSVTLTVERKDESATHLVSDLIDKIIRKLKLNIYQIFTNVLHFCCFRFQILDSRDLNIKKAMNDETGEILDFKLTPGEDSYSGSKLEIKLPSQGNR